MKSIHVSLMAATAAASIFAVGSMAAADQKHSPRAPSAAAASAQPAGKRLSAKGTAQLLVASPAQLVIAANAGSQASRTLSVTYGGAGGYLDVVQDSTALAPDPTVTPLGDGRFNVTLRTSSNVAAGVYRGSLRLRMCTESPCVNVIAGASRSVPYRLMISWVNPGEWETYQRDAGHRGYVPIVVRTTHITKIWEWNTPTPYSIHPVVTMSGKVFVMEDTWFAPNASLYALSEVNGAELWRQDFTDFNLTNPPAVSGGKVYVATTGHEKTFLFSFESSDGAPVFQSAFDSQWPNVLAPTIKDGVAYTNGGYYGGGTYAFDAEDGMLLWSRFNGDDDMTTPAVENGHVYHYEDEVGLQVYDSSNGNTTASIADPMEPEWHGYSYRAAPMLGSPDHVIALSGNNYWDTNGGRYLIDYSPASNASRWTSARRYVGTPATKDGVVYATSHNPAALDAIDEATGQVLWSWTPGLSETVFHNNVVVTRNLAFVSTKVGTYAIDLATRQPVWSTPTPGNLSISGNGTLYIVEGSFATGAFESTGRLLAFSLR